MQLDEQFGRQTLGAHAFVGRRLDEAVFQRQWPDIDRAEGRRVHGRSFPQKVYLALNDR
ncbi:hypothetical protein D3C77_785110 [compost metagenome]